VNSHSPVGLVRRQSDAFDWVCVQCDRRFHKSPLVNGDFRFVKSQMWTVGGLTGLVDATICQKSLYESCRMGRRIVVMKLICLLGHCECDGHTVQNLSQRRLTAEWLAPRESDYSRMHSKVSSDGLSSYIKAVPTVLDVFKMAGYFPGGQRMKCSQKCVRCYLSYKYFVGRRRFPEVQYFIKFCLCYKGAYKTTLSYTPESHGSDFRWCLWKFSLI
jgi:hypothetical protein